MDEHEGQPPAHAREILQYYLANQPAAQTLEGIAEWLLLEELVQRHVEETEAALRWLVSRGFLERVTVSMAAPAIYRLNTGKVHEAERLLETPDQE